MTEQLRVQLWGDDIGYLVRRDSGRYSFDYTTQGEQLGYEVSPIHYRNGDGPFSITPEFVPDDFDGLPGVINDYRPDRFGRSVINAYLESIGHDGSVNALTELVYRQDFGVGAMTFEPSKTMGESKPVQTGNFLRDLADQAQAVLSGEDVDWSISKLFRLGSSVAGDQPKALVHYNPDDSTVRPGDQPVGDGKIPAIIKFDGVSIDSDRSSLGEPKKYNRIEQAYNRMARDAGIEMPRIQSIGENGYQHLIIPRFDVDPDGTTYHMHTLGGLRQRSHRNPGCDSYTGYMKVARAVGLGTQSQVQVFRRMVFNVAAINQDDHVKNHAFLMGPDGEWKLSPAYDLTYANGDGFTSSHQLLVNGKRSGITLEDLRTVGEKAGLEDHRVDDVLDEVLSVVSDWPTYAEDAGLDSEVIESKQKELRKRNCILKGDHDESSSPSM